MKCEIVIQQRKVHVTHNQHTLIWKNNLAIQKLQNYKKEHLQNGSLIKKHFNDASQTIRKILQNRKKLTDEMNLRFRTAKPLEKNTFVLVTNQQQVDGVSKKLLPLKTGPHLIIDKPTETTYRLKDSNKVQITIHRNHLVLYYPKEKHIKLELQNYLLTNEIPTLKQPNVTTESKSSIKQSENEHTHQYNLCKRKITLLK